MDNRSTQLHIAIVFAPDGIQFAAGCRTERTLVRLLAAYVVRRSSKQLWPAEARRIRRLVRRGAAAQAVDYYFARVGERWDEDRLVRFSMHPRPRSAHDEDSRRSCAAA